MYEEKAVVSLLTIVLRNCVSKTIFMICFSFHFLQVEFVETNAVVIKIVPVEVHNYLITNSAAFLAILAAVELKMEK